jgi:hypothetical protein
MNWREVFTNKRIFLIIIAITAAVALTEAYVNSPTILLWLNPKNNISITDVEYPSVAYRSQTLPITVFLSNTGDAKDALVEVASMDNPTISSNIQLSGRSGNTTFWLPLKIEGNQSFSVSVTWIGPGGYCQIAENTSDKPFEVLAADYDCTSPSVIASRAQGWDWTISVTNTGNTPANLTLTLFKNDPLILSDNSGGTAEMDNLGIGEERSVTFHFDVPDGASLGDHTITVCLTTTYPDIAHYGDCKEVTYQSFNYNVQESPIKTELNNANYLLVAALGIVITIAGAGAILTGKRKGFK